MENALRRLDGVAEVDTKLLGKTVVVLPARDRALDLAALGPAVWEAGFSVVRIRAEAEGRVEAGGFRIRGWPRPFPLHGAVPADGLFDVIVDGGSVELRGE